MQADENGWRPVPGSPQEAFLRRVEFEGLYGGAAGGMKTETLISLPVEDLLKHANISVAFFRRQYGMMEDVIARAKELFTPLGAQFNESKRRFTFKNGSRYYFHHLQHEKDKLIYQGRKFEIILFDELTHFTESQYLYLFSRCRGNPAVRWRVRSATNPGGIGHGWVKRRWITAMKPYKTSFFLRIGGEDVRVHPETPYARSRFWMPAKVWDNPYLRDTEYVANLMAMDAEMRAMLLEGEWDIFSGQFFTSWRQNIHVVEPFRLPEHWNYFGGFDYGHRNPTCYLIAGVDQDDNVWIVNEHYEDGKSIEHHAKKIKEMEAAMFGIKVKARLADPSIWTRTPKETEAGTDDSIAQMYARRGIDFIAANNQRVIGWAAMKEYMEWGDKAAYNGDLVSVTQLPRLRIFSTCRNLIGTIPDLIYEDTEGNRRNTSPMLGEDLDTRGNDHAADAARYLLMHVYKPAKTRIKKNDWREKLRRNKMAQQRKTILSFN